MEESKLRDYFSSYIKNVVLGWCRSVEKYWELRCILKVLLILFDKGLNGIGWD